MPLATRRRVISLLFYLNDERWLITDVRELAKQVCPDHLGWGFARLRQTPESLVALLNSEDYRGTAARLLFEGLHWNREIVHERMKKVDRSQLMTRPSDSPRVDLALTALRIVATDLDGLSVDKFSTVVIRAALPNPIGFLRRVYRASQKSRLVDDLIVGAALQLLSSRLDNPHSLTRLIAEILAARESNLANRVFANSLKLPEGISNIQEI